MANAKRAFWIYCPLCAGIVLLSVAGLFAQASLTALSELERTKLQLVKEQQKNNQAQAQLIYQAHAQNQKDADTLAQQERTLTQTICKAHGLTPDTCRISPDMIEVIATPAPQSPTPNGGKGQRHRRRNIERA